MQSFTFFSFLSLQNPIFTVSCYSLLIQLIVLRKLLSLFSFFFNNTLSIWLNNMKSSKIPWTLSVEKAVKRTFLPPFFKLFSFCNIPSRWWIELSFLFPYLFNSFASNLSVVLKVLVQNFQKKITPFLIIQNKIFG